MGKGNEAIEIHGKDQPWANNDNMIWLVSTVSISRNVEKFPFPAKLDLARRKQIIALISKNLLKESQLKEPILLKVEEMTPVEKELFAEHFLANSNFQQLHSGEAFVLDGSGVFLAGINIDNHIQFELMEIKGELENAWNQLVKIEMSLGTKFNYAFSSRFGFLTSEPAISGTGLVLSGYLQPSALIHTNKISETLNRLKNDRLIFTSIRGGIEEYVGDILVVKNNYSLGVTEESIISNLRLFITKLLVEENSIRSQLKQKENGEIMDKVSRAFGILIHSYRMETQEALNEIALIKLGVDLGWVEGVTPSALNHLFFHCRRAHLLSDLKDIEIPPDQILHKRAEFIHRTLKDAKLKI